MPRWMGRGTDDCCAHSGEPRMIPCFFILAQLRKMIVYSTNERWFRLGRDAHQRLPCAKGAVAKRLRERKCSVFSRIYQKCESFQAFSPPVSFADSPLVRGGRWAAKRSFTAKTIPGGSGKQRFPMRRTRIRGGPCPSAGLRNQPENMKKWRCPGLNARGTLSYLGRKAAKRFSGKNRLRFSPRRKPGQPRPRPWPRRDPLWDRRRRG